MIELYHCDKTLKRVYSNSLPTTGTIKFEISVLYKLLNSTSILDTIIIGCNKENEPLFSKRIKR